jgi:hypothetical protein
VCVLAQRAAVSPRGLRGEALQAGLVLTGRVRGIRVREPARRRPRQLLRDRLELLDVAGDRVGVARGDEVGQLRRQPGLGDEREALRLPLGLIRARRRLVAIAGESAQLGLALGAQDRQLFLQLSACRRQ